MEQLNRLQRTFVLLILSLLVLGLPISLLCSFVLMSGWWNDGLVTNHNEWPKALLLAIEKHAEAIDDIHVYDMSAYFDRRSIWWIDGHPELVDDFIKQHALEPTTRSHPKVDRLLDSIPWAWQKPNLNNSEWYATPGSGSIHIEGPDLFLLVIDREQHVTIVLYNNIM